MALAGVELEALVSEPDTLTNRVRVWARWVQGLIIKLMNFLQS